MKQYWEIKSLHKDKILLFRMGDFFEMFHEDAEVAAPVLNIALTVRNKKAGDTTKMCGVPHHSIAGPIGKLLGAGFKVAICDQIEPASQTKSLVKRAVVRVLTPGMVYDPETLDELSAHYLCAFDQGALSFVDTSTGEAFFYSTEDNHIRQQLISLLQPVEIVLTAEQKSEVFSKKDKGDWDSFHISVFEGEYRSNQTGQLEFDSKPIPLSASRLLAYIKSQKGSLTTLRSFQKKNLGQELYFSKQAVDHLELFKTYDGDIKSSLFSTVNRTKTPPGARLLRARLRHPSTNLEEIKNRFHSIEKWKARPVEISEARTLLSCVGDIERKIGKISHIQCNGRDLLNLAESLRIGLELLPLDKTLVVPSSTSGAIRELSEELTRVIRPDAPATNQIGGLIQKEVSVELDQLITENEKRQSSLRQLEEKERIQTGIPSLKIRYNQVFGYYIEVTKIHTKKVPDYYLRKQTLTSAERYTTKELQEVEIKILSSRSRRSEMELLIFEETKQKVLGALSDLFYFSRILTEMDLNVAFAYLAIEQSYVRPIFSFDNKLILVNSRHPVVEQKQQAHFIPNTIRIKRGECLLLTGPNMAGKSTLMRQVALSVILAQAGSFVPAEQALLPIFTKLFTRIGASDSLSKGLSTFMTEMQESVEILKQADSKSLVILDEIGRGTATYDGMSLAQAILEYLVQKKQSLIFFATHYHELTSLEQTLPVIRNAHLSVSEEKGDINFLYTLKPGALAQSYGVHVARLAGFPMEVVERAEQLLKNREARKQISSSVFDHQYSTRDPNQSEKSSREQPPEQSQGHRNKQRLESR